MDRAVGTSGNEMTVTAEDGALAPTPTEVIAEIRNDTTDPGVAFSYRYARPRTASLSRLHVDPESDETSTL